MNSGDAPWVVILSAGEGSRVLNLTRDRSGAPAPKQFALIDGRNTLLENTVRRAARIAPRERIVIVVARRHHRWWAPELARLAPSTILVQPENRGTAAGILLPLLWITAADPEARLVILPSDHGVVDEHVLGNAIADAVAVTPNAESGIVLLGVRPEVPQTDYGWIVPCRPGGATVSKVACFREKPSAAAAAELFDHGGLLNCFIMVAGGRALVDRFRVTTPGLWRSFGPIRQSLATGRLTGDELAARYRAVPNIDFSKQVLEQSANALRVIPAAPCGWCDLGTPERLTRHLTQRHGDTSPAPPYPTAGTTGTQRVGISSRSVPYRPLRVGFDSDSRTTVRRSAGSPSIGRTEATEVIP